jgi:uncharacterized coiled-coil protein SlyX
MSRKTPVAGPTISLFPFLAVLLCTMGALLVVLVLFSRSVRQNEAAKLDEAQESLAEELQLTRDSLAWRREQLAGVRERTAEELATARLQLAGIEESTRALQDEFEKLERTAAALASQAGTVAVDEETLRGLEQRLTSARESLDKARAEGKTKPPAYAVVPYVGQNGTHRRPLYIECCGDGVFLQPEGIRLSPGDFEGPPGPGNPLASALRAAREHVVAAQGGTNDRAAQPYPLLLVRPSGVMAYYAAREAIQSWGSDFGYQLIDEDWTLTFPPADPTLAQVEKRAIEESRARLAWLAEVRPSRPAKPSRQYRAATTRGGVVADGGPSVLGDQSRWDWANSNQSGGAAAGGGSGGGGQGPGGTGSTGSGDGTGPSGGRRGDVARGNASGAGEFNGTDPVGGDAILGGEAGGTEQGTFSGKRPAGGGGQSDAALVGGRYRAGSRFAAGGAAGTGGGATAEGGSAAGTALAGDPTATSGAGGSAGAGGRSAATGAAGGGTNQGGGGSAGGGSGPAMPGLVQAGGSAGGQAGAAGGASASASLAQSRGKNWASLATQDRPIPLTRPIRLECSLQEFRLFDDSGRRVETRIAVPGATAEAIDPLVAAIHARVDRWGIAGDRMYWKPQLVLSETTDGRSRREELERLLADSGLDTRSSDVRDVIRPLPPIERTTGLVPSR